MQASTVVINPPDGDMAAYLDSLRSLAALDLDWLAPGHGFLMAEPRAAMEAIVAHRLKREAKVVAALARARAGAGRALLGTVYADVPAHLHAMAMRSLTAHLLKLRDDGARSECEAAAAGRRRATRQTRALQSPLAFAAVLLEAAADAESAQRVDRRRVEAPVAQRDAAAAAALGRRPGARARRAVEARRRRRLGDAADLDDAAARGDVRMAARLGERQHRREAGVRAVEDARTIRRAFASRRSRRSARAAPARCCGRAVSSPGRRRGRAARAARRRTSPRSRRSRRVCRRASRRCRTTARPSRAR